MTTATAGIQPIESVIAALRAGGYSLDITGDGITARRTAATTMKTTEAQPLLLQLMRRQTEAVDYMKAHKNHDAYQIAAGLKPKMAPVLAMLIESGSLTERDEAICYCKYNIALGYTKTSDDRLWIDVLQELLDGRS